MTNSRMHQEARVERRHLSNSSPLRKADDADSGRGKTVRVKKDATDEIIMAVIAEDRKVSRLQFDAIQRSR